MNHYVYRSALTNNIVFEIAAETILEADAKYREATGKDVAKQPDIKCGIIFNKERANAPTMEQTD